MWEKGFNRVICCKKVAISHLRGMPKLTILVAIRRRNLSWSGNTTIKLLSTQQSLNNAVSQEIENKF